MLGYTTPLYSRMSAPDLADYRRYYCETCHELRGGFGLFSTAAVNYDMTFNTILLNSISGDVLDFGHTKNGVSCVFRGPYADSDVMRKMAGYTVLLTKWELVDDEYDKPSKRNKFISLALNRAIRKAERLYPEYDVMVGEGYTRLRSMELDGCTDPIKIGSEFGLALSKPLEDIAGDRADERLSELFVYLTSIVYLMDAVDDLDKDYMDGTYNPFLARYSDFMEGRPETCVKKDCGCSGVYTNRNTFINHNLYEITDMMNSVISGLQTSYSFVRKRMRSSVGVTDNIVMHGIPESAKNVITGRGAARTGVKDLMEGHKERNRSS